MRAWWRRRPPAPEPVEPVQAVMGPIDDRVQAACEDEVLELLGVVILGETERVRESLVQACQAGGGAAISFLVIVLVGELRRDGYEAAVERLQQLSLTAKARREPTP